MMTGRALPRILPFAVFMAFIGAEETLRSFAAAGMVSLPAHALYYLYPARALTVGLLLVLFRHSCPELRAVELKERGRLLVSVVAGVMVFLLWVRMDWSFATQGSPPGFDPGLLSGDFTRLSMTAVRLAGAVLVVPVMEELFWRSFLTRYVIAPDFQNVAIGRFTWPSFLVTSLLFGLEHHLFLAGIMAGAAYNLLLYHTRSITHCIVAHAVTNLALGLYVLFSGKWYFW